jgi:hypothetical protein
MRKWIAVGGGSIAVALLATGYSAAALSLRFDRATARPGDFVTASQPGFRVTGVVVYLVPTRLPGVKPDPGGGYLLRRAPARNAFELGALRLTPSGRLSIRFRVPHVPPGEYTTAFSCPTCTKGGDFFASVSWGQPWSHTPSGVIRITR